MKHLCGRISHHTMKQLCGRITHHSACLFGFFSPLMPVYPASIWKFEDEQEHRMEPEHQWKVTAIISSPAQACGSQDQRGKAMSAILYPGNNCKYQTEAASKDQCMDMSDSCLQVKRHKEGSGESLL